MSLFTRRERLSVEAPPSPETWTVLELTTLRTMVAAAKRRAERKAKQNEAAREAGTAPELPGADSDALRADLMSGMHEKFEAWLDKAWPLVDAANAARGLPPEDDRVFDVDGDPEREAWMAESRTAGERLAERLGRAQGAGE